MREKKPQKGLLHWGSSYGGKWSSRIVGPFDQQFYNDAGLFDDKIYFKTLKYLNITWRVAGEILDYQGLEGPNNLRYWRESKFIGIDMVIPMSAWKGRKNQEILAYTLVQLPACFNLLVKRALKAEEVLDEVELRNDFKQLLQIYEKNSLEKLCGQE